MTRRLEIRPAGGPVNITIQPPGSKSLTNRALLCAALSEGKSTLTNALDSDDTRIMIEALAQLGVQLEFDPLSRVVVITGCGGHWPNENAKIQVGNSGTTIRFLTAVLGIGGGRYSLDGVPRMRQRPIGDLCSALEQLGVQVVATSAGQCPPVVINSQRSAGGNVVVCGDTSSQYLSGLMLAAPLASGDVDIAVAGPLVSRPYVRMTRSIMARFGIQCQLNPALDSIRICGGQSYRATDIDIEPDASAASYFWAAAAICGGSATVIGLDHNAMQGDIGFADCLRQMGCAVSERAGSITVAGPAQEGIVVDMSDISDTVQTLAAVALFVDGPTTIQGVAHNRGKETDRIGNLAIELRKFGARIEERSDGLVIHPPARLAGAEIETYNDHRMAMSLALVGLKLPGVVILDPQSVSKTYPRYFADLSAVTETGES